MESLAGTGCGAALLVTAVSLFDTAAVEIVEFTCGGTSILGIVTVSGGIFAGCSVKLIFVVPFIFGGGIVESDGALSLFVTNGFDFVIGDEFIGRIGIRCRYP